MYPFCQEFMNFPKYWSHLKIIDASRVTKFNSEDPQIVGTTIHNPVIWATQGPGFVSLSFFTLTSDLQTNGIRSLSDCTTVSLTPYYSSTLLNCHHHHHHTIITTTTTITCTSLTVNNFTIYRILSQSQSLPVQWVKTLQGFQHTENFSYFHKWKHWKKN
jgi:hypothetical protein